MNILYLDHNYYLHINIDNNKLNNLLYNHYILYMCYFNLMNIKFDKENKYHNHNLSNLEYYNYIDKYY